MHKEANKQYWSPYLAGSLAGLLLVFSVWVSGKFFGSSTTFVRSAGMLEKIFTPERVARMDYFIKEAPIIDWQWMFIAGILIGSLIASKASGTFQLKLLPDMWQDRFGTGVLKRALVAFAGGAIAMLGARLADGCPSGHGLSGAAQLAISGFIALACFFTGGIIVARLLYAGGKQQ